MLRKRFCRAAFYRTLLFAGFTTFFSKLLFGNRVNLYIHPRMNPLVWITIGILGLMTIYQASEILTVKVRKYPPFRLGYFLIVLPLLLAFTGPAGTLSTRLAGQRPIQLGAGASGVLLDSMIKREDTIDLSEEIFPKKGDKPIETPARKADESGLAPREISELSFSDDMYVESLTKIHEDMEGYLGQRIELSGFIYRIGPFGPQEFVIARYLVSCCVADAQVVGLYAAYPNIEQKNPFVWIHAKGVLEAFEFQGERIPILRVDYLEEIPSPKNPYLYR